MTVERKTHPGFSIFDILKTVFPNLPAEDIVRAERVNGFFNTSIRHLISESVPLQMATRSVKHCLPYREEGADLRYFSIPWGNQQHLTLKLLTHQGLFRLADRLQADGDRPFNPFEGPNKVVSRIGLTRMCPYDNVSDDWRCTPTHIIHQIPDEEIGRVYYHMWRMIGSPTMPNAGKDAFYDRKGLHSTPEQKAEALMAFLREKSKVPATTKELTQVLY